MSVMYCDDSKWKIYKKCDEYRIHKNVSLFGYKAFNSDMTCLKQKYEIGKTYTMDKNELCMCKKGFHFCRYPIDVLLYYPNSVMFAIINADDCVIESFDNCVTNHITIIKMITKDELLQQMPTMIIRMNDWHELYKNGLLHSDNDLPAFSDGQIHEWRFNGKLHRDNDLPAFIEEIDDKLFFNGMYHLGKDDRPIIRGKCQEWWINGKRHREDNKPAIVCGDRQEWWINGMRIK